MANVLILTLVFPPDNVSTAQIMSGLASDLKRCGHEVRVLTTTPHFNDDPDALARQPLHPHWGRLIQKSIFEGIPVYHVAMPRKGASKALRILAWLGFHLVSTVFGVLLPFRPNVIFAPSPPLTIGVSAWILGFRFRVPFIYNVQEIYPDVAIHLGALKNPLFIRSLYAIERFVYRRAAALTSISQGMCNRLLAKGVPTAKIHLIPNYVDIHDLTPLPKRNKFSIAHNLDRKFVVSYAGNMGKPQGLKVLLQAADVLRKESQIHFLLLGDGSERSELKRMADQLGLTNLTLLPSQPYALMQEAYAASDVSFVSQAFGTHNDGIPSKVYRIMACSRPVLAVSDPQSDLAQLIRESGAGIITPPGNAEELALLIRKAATATSSLIDMGTKGREFVIANNSRESVNARYISLLETLASY